MTSQIDLIFALQQVENISNLVKENKYEQFFVSHLFPIKFELERQINLLNHGKEVV